jgi:fatty acid desaturase
VEEQKKNDDNDDYGDANPVASVAALNALVPRSRITPLLQSKSNLHGTFQVAFHLAMFSLSAAVPWPIISILAMAFVSSFFFHGLHETVHGTAFSSRWANHVASLIFGLLCLRPARHYYYYHWQHHRYTGNAELDSELTSSSLLDFQLTMLQDTYCIYPACPFGSMPFLII